MSKLLNIITSGEASVRDTALAAACERLSPDERLEECEALDEYRREAEKLYEPVRALRTEDGTRLNSSQVVTAYAGVRLKNKN